MVRDNTYRNSCGKYQSVADALHQEAPEYGITSNEWMNCYIILAEMYYEMYYSYPSIAVEGSMFDRYVKPHLPKAEAAMFMGGREEEAENVMDEALLLISMNDWHVENITVFLNPYTMEWSKSPNYGTGWRMERVGDGSWDQWLELHSRYKRVGDGSFDQWLKLHSRYKEVGADG